MESELFMESYNTEWDDISQELENIKRKIQSAIEEVTPQEIIIFDEKDKNSFENGIITLRYSIENIDSVLKKIDDMIEIE